MRNSWAIWNSRLAAHRERRRTNRLERIALEIALVRFSQLHSSWYLSYFDGHFLGRFEPAVLRGLDPAALAMEWTRQFRYRDERRRSSDLRRLTPVAEHFLCLLDEARAEVRREWELRREQRTGAAATSSGSAP